MTPSERARIRELAGKAISCLIFAPALLAWLVFAPSFRFANWLTDKAGINEGHSLWYWLQVQAIDHPVYLQDKVRAERDRAEQRLQETITRLREQTERLPEMFSPVAEKGEGK